MSSICREALRRFSSPSASRYIGPETAARLHALGVIESNSTSRRRRRRSSLTCVGLSWEEIWEALLGVVPLAGRGRVCSNIIVGLGETDENLERVMRDLAEIGVIPVLRPLTPAGSLADRHRPSADRLLRLYDVHEDILRKAGLDPARALTMCSACTGCDLVPGRER